MVSTGKLMILATVGGVTLILGTVALGLTLLLNQRTAIKLKNTSNNHNNKVSNHNNDNKDSFTSSNVPQPQHQQQQNQNQNQHGQYQINLDNDYYSKKLNEYKTYGPDPTSTELSSEAHFKLAIELFGIDGTGSGSSSFPLGEFEEKETSPFVINTPSGSSSSLLSGSSSSNNMNSYMTSVSDLKSISLSSLIKWGSTYISNAQAKIQRSANKRRQQKRRKRRGNKNEMEDLAWEHLRKAAELGYPDAQYVLGNAYISGMFWKDGGEATSSMTNGGRNVSLGLANWHMAAIGGNIEAAVNLGFRYYSSDEKNNNEEADYGVAVLPGQRCKMAKAYYEEAAHGVIDALEQGPSRGKVTPAIDRHKLSEIFVAGTSSGLSGYNKPDELKEALEYYRLRAMSVDKSNPSSMDVHAALTLAQFHHYGLRGVLQDLNQALKFYEIAANGGNREAAGMAGSFHFFGLGYDNYSNITSFTTAGTSPNTNNNDNGEDSTNGPSSSIINTPFDETLHPIQFGNLYKAHEYLVKATSTGGIEECFRRSKKKEDTDKCDAEGLNGMGLLHLFGLPGVIKKNRAVAIRYFQLGKAGGSVDATFHIALVYMGWMKQRLPEGSNNIKKENKEHMTRVEEEFDDDNYLTQAISPMNLNLDNMKFIDNDGNPMTVEEMAELLGPNGMELLNQLEMDVDNGIQEGGFAAGANFDDGDVMVEGGNVPPQVRGLLQKIALAAAKGAGKAEGNFDDGSEYKIQTKVVYANKDSSYGGHNGPSSNSHPTKSDYESAIHELSQAVANRHIQAAHRLATIYSHGIPHPRYPQQYLVPKNCQAALRLFKQVTDNSPYVSRRSRRAYKQYMSGDVTSSLLNYLVLAEGGSEVGQLNAAWLLEQGYCLNMSNRNCLRASLRMWRAAARQGSSEASLRVGDFYYYGKMAHAEQKKQSKSKYNNIDDEFDIFDNELWYNKIYRWILYPEQMMKEGRAYLIKYIKHTLNSRSKEKSNESSSSSVPPSSHTCIATDDKTCPAEEQTTDASSSEQQHQDNTLPHDMTTAAMYYRKAAQATSNARANFNLGYMHEWGLGLKQDFPLAKRHYDLARNSNREAYAVIQIALFSMSAHEKAINFLNFLKRWWDEIEDEHDNDLVDEDASIWKRGGYRLKYVIKKYVPKTYHPRWKLIMSHIVVLDWEMFGIICLSLVLIKFLMALRQRRA